MGSEMSSLHDDDGLVVEEVPNMQLIQQAGGSWKVFVDGEEVIVAEIEVRPSSHGWSRADMWTSGDSWVDTSNQRAYISQRTDSQTYSIGDTMQVGEETYTLQGPSSSTSLHSDLVLSKDQIEKLKDNLGLDSEDD